MTCHTYDMVFASSVLFLAFLVLTSFVLFFAVVAQEHRAGDLRFSERNEARWRTAAAATAPARQKAHAVIDPVRDRGAQWAEERIENVWVRADEFQERRAAHSR